MLVESGCGTKHFVESFDGNALHKMFSGVGRLLKIAEKESGSAKRPINIILTNQLVISMRASHLQRGSKKKAP